VIGEAEPGFKPAEDAEWCAKIEYARARGLEHLSLAARGARRRLSNRLPATRNETS